MIVARIAPWIALAIIAAAGIGLLLTLATENVSLRRDNAALQSQLQKQEEIRNAVEGLSRLDDGQLDVWLRQRAGQ